MPSDIHEPDNRPKERIERLIGSNNAKENRRIHPRISVEAGTEVFFPLICRGEISDVSDEGISIRFKPLDSINLKDGEKIQLSMPLENHTFLIPASVKRVESRFGVIILGMSFDPEEIDIQE